MTSAQVESNDAMPWLLCLGFAALLVFFYSLNTGITCTNDGSHFALMRSLAERGTSLLGPDLVFARHDAAFFEGQYYSDRHPGLGFLGFLYLKLFAPLASHMAALRLDPWSLPHLAGAEGTVALLMLLPALGGALLFLMLYRLLRLFGSAPFTAAGVSLVMLTSTLLLRYSTLLYSHVFSTLAVTCGFHLVVAHDERGGSWRLFAGVASLCSAVVIEHSTVLLLLPVAVFLLVRQRAALFEPSTLLGIAVAGLAPVVPLLVYNAVNFGGPFTIAHFHHASVAQHHEVASTFAAASFPIQSHLLLFAGPPFVSLFRGSPHLLFALAAIPLFAARRVRWTRRYALSLALFVMAFLPASFYVVVVGGFDRDYRQILYGLPFLAVFVCVPLDWLDRAQGRALRWGVRPVAWVAFLGLAAYSMQLQLAHVRHAGQAEMGQIFVNLGPALSNTAPLMVVGFMVTAAWVVSSRRAVPGAIAPRG